MLAVAYLALVRVNLRWHPRVVEECVDPYEQVRAARRVREHPFDTEAADLEPSLIAAINYVVANGAACNQDRAERMEVLIEIGDELEPLSQALRDRMRPLVRQIAGKMRLALLAALIDAANWPHKRMVRDFISGFDVAGNIPDTGVFKEGGANLPYMDSNSALPQDRARDTQL